LLFRQWAVIRGEGVAVEQSVPVPLQPPQCLSSLVKSKQDAAPVPHCVSPVAQAGLQVVPVVLQPLPGQVIVAGVGHWPLPSQR
jgi:hypothetical protein